MKQIFKIVVVAAVWMVSSCENKTSSSDEVVVTAPGGGTEKQITEISWLTTTFIDSKGVVSDISRASLSDGGPTLPINISYSTADEPLSRFEKAVTDFAADATPSPIAFLAFYAEENAAVTISHKKVFEGASISQQSVTPRACPESFLPTVETANRIVFYCIALTNSGVPGLLSPSDKAGAYSHVFEISAKTLSATSGRIASTIGLNVVIPTASLSLAPSSELSELSLAERISIVSNDLVGSARRDAKIFTIKSDVTPGALTSYRIVIEQPKATIEQEIFFEQPVSIDEFSAQPVVSRGERFFKRRVAVNSNDHFRLRIVDNRSPERDVSLTPKKTTTLNYAIEDASEVLSLAFVFDFGDGGAPLSFREYVQPFAPSFCPLESVSYRPEEWRQQRRVPGYVACEARTLRRYQSLEELSQASVGSPTETFFGSFSYMPRLDSKILGGTHGVLAMRIYLSGKITVYIQSPQDGTNYEKIGELDLAYLYQLPSATAEMEELVFLGKAPSGLESILSSMRRKGVVELIDNPITGLPQFPFLGGFNSRFLY